MHWEEVAGYGLWQVASVDTGSIQEVMDEYHGTWVYMVKTNQKLTTTVTSLQEKGQNVKLSVHRW